MKEWWLFKNLANVITLIRLLCAVVIFPYLFIFRPYDWLNLFRALLILFLSDVLDGLVARQLEIISDFGEKFDAFTDKIAFVVLTAGIIVLYWPPSAVSGFFVFAASFQGIMLICLEVSQLVLCVILYRKGYRGFKAIKLGKWKMNVEGAIPLIWFFALSNGCYFHGSIIKISLIAINIFLTAALILFILSARQYWRRYKSLSSKN